MEYKKEFHGQYDGTAKIIVSTCSECGEEDKAVVQFIAEENVGELFTVEVCLDCMNKYVDQIKHALAEK